MGQKVNPHGFRVGIIKDWSSRWYANDKDFADYLIEDQKIRRVVEKQLANARVSEVIIERNKNDINLIINTAKPGMVIGKNGSQLEELKTKLKAEIGKDVSISVKDIKKPDLDAQVVSENIAEQLERRVSFRKAMKQAMYRTKRAGAKGIKVAVSGRLGGADMARTEFYKEGTVPLQTIRADIDYGFAEADTTYGKMGVKVWIYKGNVFRDSDGKLVSEGGFNKATNEDEEEKEDKRNSRDRRPRNNRRKNNNRRDNKNTPKKENNKEVADGINS